MMNTTMRNAVRLGLVVGLAVTGLVGVTSLSAAGTGERPMVSYGTLTLNLTDRAGSLTFERAPGFGGGMFTQALGVATPCSTLISGPIAGPGTPPAGVNLLNFTAAVTGGSSPNVQLPSNTIGVTDGANCGEPSGLVGPGETLTLDLGGFLPTDVVVGTGTLQIGKSRGSDGNLKLAYDGANFGTAITVANSGQGIAVADADGKFRSISIQSTANQSSRGLSLRSSTVLNLMAPAPATAPDAPTNVTAEGGAVRTVVSWTAPEDDGGLPINTYELRYFDTSEPGTFTAVDPTTATNQVVSGLASATYVFEVRAVNGAGAGDWAQSNALTINALPVDCGGTVQVDGVEGDIADSVTFLRGENQDKPGQGVADGCLEVDATVKIVSGDTTAPEGVTDYVFWDNTFEDINGEIQRVNATVTIDWAPVASADAAVLNRVIDYDGPTGPGPYRETLWCESFTQVSVSPVEYSAVLPDWTYTDGTDGAITVNGELKAPWCLVSDTRVQQAGEILQTEVLFGSGDPSRTGSFR